MASINGNLNLTSVHKAKDKYIKNRQIILEFLSTEKYSNARIFMELLSIKTRSGMSKILRKMAGENLIKKHEVTPLLVLWGITSDGLHTAINEHNTITDWAHFEPSKINLATLDHQFDIQKIHAYCHQYNMFFQPGRMLGSRAHADKVPDGVISIGDRKIAVEVERHIKSKRRYDAVIYNYLKSIKAGNYEEVIYIAPSQLKSDQIKKVFYNLKTITMTINGRIKKLSIDEKKHLSYFKFISIQEIPAYLSAL